ncbi:Short-chain dehydrogenase [Coniochaeta hoffmannii]|uniref:Short-chain dehydrogenase n=1 Tax=Coniochaeta hoffmannii TaxID=91930 RepID=A0AA38RP42_9PEZI|nr:Short-chain dehydrogenase [Coniochaeta hoffmannii]
MASLVRGTAFITGAASGIGQYTALSFAKYGIQRLALADINLAALKKSSAALSAKYPGVEILNLEMNVQDTKQVRAGIAETVKKFGRLDIAVNNAGIGGSGVITHELEEEEWMRVIDIDFNGVWRCQKEELGVMVGQEDLGPREGRGRIINVASMYGVSAPCYTMYQTAYTAAKHGVVGLTRADANSYARQNIRINAICPGYVETPLLATMSLEPGSPLALDIERTPMKRMATTEEIGDTITFLASPLSSFMQGAALVADGGFTTS